MTFVLAVERAIWARSSAYERMSSIGSDHIPKVLTRLIAPIRTVAIIIVHGGPWYRLGAVKTRPRCRVRPRRLIPRKEGRRYTTSLLDTSEGGDRQGKQEPQHDREVDVEVDAATAGKTSLTTARPSRDRRARVPLRHVRLSSIVVPLPVALLRLSQSHCTPKR